MHTALVHIALLAYVAGAAAYLVWLLKSHERLVGIGRLCLFLGLVTHLASFVATPGLVTAGVGSSEWRSGELFSLLAAVTVLGYLLLDLKYSLPVAGAFVGPLTVAVMVPAHLVQSNERTISPLLSNSVALFAHVGTAALGTGALGLAFALALLYLASEKQVKAKRPGRLVARLPSLELLDRAGYQLAVWGFAFLSIAIATGSLVSKQSTGGAFPLDFKQTFAVLAWGLFAALIQARLVAGWRGRRVAMLVVVGFVLLAASYVGLLAAPALHGGVA